MPHVPFVQEAWPFAGTLQAMPQPPQLAVLVAVSMQLPPHFVVPGGQTSVQLPAEQTSPEAHWVLHPPQWAGLDCVSAQTAPHLAEPGLQEKAHCPPEHDAVPLAGTLQLCPQPPQWLESVWVSTHAPLQEAKPVLHAKPQELAVQVAVAFGGAGQLVLQAPQWFALIAVSTHEAPHAISGGVQLEAQIPFWQTWPVAHAPAHEPQ